MGDEQREGREGTAPRKKHKFDWGWRTVLIAAGLFWVLCSIFALQRFYNFFPTFVSFDQGIFSGRMFGGGRFKGIHSSKGKETPKEHSMQAIKIPWGGLVQRLVKLVPGGCGFATRRHAAPQQGNTILKIHQSKAAVSEPTKDAVGHAKKASSFVGKGR